VTERRVACAADKSQILQYFRDPRRWFCPVCMQFLPPETEFGEYVSHLARHNSADLAHAIVRIAVEAALVPGAIEIEETSVVGAGGSGAA